jgi:hypothetical protein
MLMLSMPLKRAIIERYVRLVWKRNVAKYKHTPGGSTTPVSCHVYGWPSGRFSGGIIIGDLVACLRGI